MLEHLILVLTTIPLGHNTTSFSCCPNLWATSTFHHGLNIKIQSEGLGEGYDGDIAFASTLETFGGGHNDPISVAFGGPVMTKFTIALREIGTYKEVLRSQVEHILNDRLLQFVNIDLHDVKMVYSFGKSKTTEGVERHVVC
nr:ADP-ribosylation factor GTPase-activating protein AGD3 [Tanacetum cinerariifolium]